MMLGMTDDTRWQRLGDLVKRRMEEVGATPEHVEQEGGPKPTKLRELVNLRATAFRDSLKPGLERAIQWQPGSINEVLRGGNPTPVTANHFPERFDVAELRAAANRDPEAERIIKDASPGAEQLRAASQIATKISGHPILADGASIAEVATSLGGILDSMDGMLATQQRITELANGLSAAAGEVPDFPDESELGQALQDALTADTEFRAFLADLLFQLMTTASASNAAEIRARIRPLYDRAVKGIAVTDPDGYDSHGVRATGSGAFLQEAARKLAGGNQPEGRDMRDAQDADAEAPQIPPEAMEADEDLKRLADLADSAADEDGNGGLHAG